MRASEALLVAPNVKATGRPVLALTFCTSFLAPAGS